MTRPRTWLGYPVSEWIGAFAGLAIFFAAAAVTDGEWAKWAGATILAGALVVWGVRCLIGLTATLLGR